MGEGEELGVEPSAGSAPALGGGEGGGDGGTPGGRRRQFMGRLRATAGRKLRQLAETTATRISRWGRQRGRAGGCPCSTCHGLRIAQHQDVHPSLCSWSLKLGPLQLGSRAEWKFPCAHTCLPHLPAHLLPAVPGRRAGTHEPGHPLTPHAARRAARRLPLRVSLTFSVLEGTMLAWVPPPPGDRIFLSFLRTPHLVVAAKPEVGG